MRYVFYKDNIYLITFGENCFVTAFKEKTDDTFYEYSKEPRLYARNINDGDIYDLYQLDFFVEYHGETYIVYDKRQTKKYKAVIWVECPDSTEREPKFEYKTVDVHDCGKLYAHYIYFVRGGKRLDREKAERVYADADGFETLREKHRHTKI
ncbi:MAG: hypothetical protein NC079_02255 [Clostridium sp.]|nr:hypothetical protein [Acetatifactor muris]MCM1527407.1 hypothetical protein [Bacteroides sp.]MCM1562412.1 hypothetical protein [Clostridium sp.]